MLKSTLTALSLVLASSSVEAKTLVLAVDMSGSMTTQSLNTQMSAYATHLSDPFMRNMLTEYDVEIILFAGRAYRMPTDGSVESAADAFTLLSTMEGRINYLQSLAQPLYGLNTCVSEALKKVIEIEPELSRPIVVDISGDGANNCTGQSNEDVKMLSQQLYSMDILINGLPMGPPDSPVVEFYEDMLVTGFTVVAENIWSFETALYQKLYTEIAITNGIDKALGMISEGEEQ